MTSAVFDGLFVPEKFVHLVGGPITIRRPIACTMRAHHTCVDGARRPSAIIVRPSTHFFVSFASVMKFCFFSGSSFFDFFRISARYLCYGA